MYWVDEIISLLNENGDAEQANKMSAYMQNKFEFAGIPKPKLTELIKPFLKDTSKDPIDWDMVKELWEYDKREAQYVAVSYLNKNHKKLIPQDLNMLRYLIVNKSWWETVDTIDALVGEIVMKDQSLKKEMIKWASDDNMWLRRTAIDFQQEYKTETDTEILEKIIVSNFGSKEFFINKAIGWSLRDYSKTNPQWVAAFLDKYRESMANLSVKEASKYLN